MLFSSAEVNSSEINADFESCEISPHDSRVNRLDGKTGIRGIEAEIKIASYSAYFSEEPELVGM